MFYINNYSNQDGVTFAGVRTKQTCLLASGREDL